MEINTQFIDNHYILNFYQHIKSYFPFESLDEIKNYY